MCYEAKAKFGDGQELAIDLGTWEFYAEAHQSCEMHAARVLEWDTLRAGLQQAATGRYQYQIVSSHLAVIQQQSHQQMIELKEPALQAS
ncbi:hypothetical protein [Deinococcus altitudinis]|uniref:hypothetical protein n=1 Tax=Deinococcus altitudinis TaxID=468914 RepID=UPI0038915315